MCSDNKKEISRLRYGDIDWFASLSEKKSRAIQLHYLRNETNIVYRYNTTIDPQRGASAKYSWRPLRRFHLLWRSSKFDYVACWDTISFPKPMKTKSKMYKYDRRKNDNNKCHVAKPILLHIFQPHCRRTQSMTSCVECFFSEWIANLE